MNKMVKTAIAAALALTCSSAVQVFADTQYTFSDISDPKYSWAVGYIEDMVDKGLISGYDDGTYRPDSSVTRLEVLSLFARAMGSNSAANADVLKAAQDQYLSLVETYKLNFGTNDIAYLLYRGALKESELDNYLKGDLRNEAMPRYEAAVIVTKAMCAEKSATSEIMVDLEYTDAKQIPVKASQYVYYVTKQNIMSGMGDGTFSPKSGVLRSQIAVMLFKTVDLMNLTVEELKIASVDDANIGFYDEKNNLDYMGYTANTRFYVEGELTQAKRIPINVYANFTYVDGEVAYVDISDSLPDETVSGIFQSYSSSNGIVSVTIKTDDGDKIYPFGSDVTVTYKGAKATIRDFNKSDAVTLEISGGKIKNLTGEPMSKKISNATVESISIVADGTMTIGHANEAYDGLTLEVSPTVKVKKNDNTASLADVYKGDTVTLVLDYGIVTEITASSSSKVVEGTIQSIEISSTPKMTVNVKGTAQTYDLIPGITILINNKEGSLYDFRVGDNVTITIESHAIKKIVATSVQSYAYSKSGSITSVNTAYGFIKISYTENGATYEETVYCKDSTTKFITSTGTNKTIKDLAAGNVVSVRGTVTNGAFEASLVLIEVDK